MIIQKTFLILIISLFLGFQSLKAITPAEQFKQAGYIEICDKNYETSTFNSLYSLFDEFIEFLQINPIWKQKLYLAKERFIRSKDRNLYSTDFFGFYDESNREGRNQISFYYSIHFHEFVCSNYPELKLIPQIINFFEACFKIQNPYESIFEKAAIDLGLKNIFASTYKRVPILLKVIKYLPSYKASMPHYDGTAFSLFLDSTDNASLLLSPYKLSMTKEDFYSPPRNKNSILLIPGVFLAEYFIYPTPHIVLENNLIRYATIAFAMRPNYNPQKNHLAHLPSFKY